MTLSGSCFVGALGKFVVLEQPLSAVLSPREFEVSSAPVQSALLLAGGAFRVV
jgi:hypothetical protein